MKKTTVERVVYVTEVAFAPHGLVETSWHTITTQAGVNLTSVNDYFGSKKGLLQVVAERFLESFSVDLKAHLNTLFSMQCKHLDILLQLYRGLIVAALSIVQGSQALASVCAAEICATAWSAKKCCNNCLSVKW